MTDEQQGVPQDISLGIIDSIDDAFVLLDPDFRIIAANSAAMKLETHARENIIGRFYWEAHPETAPELGERFRQAMRDSVPASLEHNYIWPDGKNMWIDMRCYPVAQGLAVFYRDVTERKRSEAREMVQIAGRNAVLAQLTEAIIVADSKGVITFVNEAAERLHGTRLLDVKPEDYADAYSLWTLDGKPYPPLELPLARAAVFDETVFDASWVIRRADGSEVIARGSARPLMLPDGRKLGAVLICQDDTQRQGAERLLREETRMLETLNRTGAALAAELDLERVVQIVSEAGVELTGAQFGAYFHNVWDASGERLHLFTLAGAERSDFEAMPHPRATPVLGPTFRNEGIIRSDDILADPRYGKNPPHNGMPHGHLPVRSYLAVSVVSRSGEVLGGLLFGHPEPDIFTHRHEDLVKGLAGQASIAIDNARLFQQVQEANSTLELRVLQRTAELEEAQDALRQSQKMEAVGQLTGGIAHDFNNLLMGITGSLELIKRQIQAGSTDRIERFADMAMASANRAAALTHRLLAFSRRQPLDPKPVDANGLVMGMADLLRRTLGEAITLKTGIEADLWRAMTDPNQLENAILNLAINARDAMPHGGTLSINARNAPLDESVASKPGDVVSGDYVCISVTDTGLGMCSSTIRKAFEPFFTTKPIGQGTGLGLSMVYGFAKQSAGFVRLESEVGKGTTVEIYLPRAHTACDVELAVTYSAPGVHPSSQGEVVLVVEDEDAVRVLVVETLKDQGYTVLEATDGPAGLEILRSSRRIDLLVTDIGLPGLNGRQVAEAARLHRSSLKVMFMTGYAETATAADGFLEPGMEMITKPFAIDELIDRVTRMLV